MIQILMIGIALVLAVGYFAIDRLQSVDDATDTSVVEEAIKNNNQPVVPVKVSETKENKTPVVSENKILDLSGEQLQKTPSYIFDKTDIQELNLSNNMLSGALPGEVRFLQNLRVLDLSNNQFTGVPAEIGQLKNLQVLDLSNNQLTGLPNELGNLSNLELLDLRGNAYTAADLESIKQRLPNTVVIEVD